MLTAKDGYSFAAGDQGPVVSNAIEGSLGSHGYLSTDPEMNGIFIARGRGIRQGARLKLIRSVDVGPTIAALLGLEMKNITGTPLFSIFSK
jgi:predicted AlkP superfamily pyrophosphatase or phosphodiesterase